MRICCLLYTRFFPNGGPLGGPAARYQPQQLGQDLEAASCQIWLHATTSELKYHNSVRDLICCEVVNPLKLVVDRPPKRETLRYQRARAQQAMYRAAAKLWSHGVEIRKAIAIVETAMKEAGEL